MKLRLHMQRHRGCVRRQSDAQLQGEDPREIEPFPSAVEYLVLDGCLLFDFHNLM